METRQVEDLMKKHEELAEYAGEDRVISSFEMREEIKKAKPVDCHRYLSRLNRLDEIIGGFRQGELVVLSGPTAHGKTTFACYLTDMFSMLQAKSLWFTFEMPPEELLNKFKVLPEFYMPREQKEGLDWVEKKIIESKLKYETEVVFVDHLHYLISMSSLASGNTSLIIGGVVRELKKMALRQNIVFVLLCHIQKINDDTKPTMSHLRDSSFICQEADDVLMIYRKLQKVEEEEEIFSNHVELAVYKNRRTGKTGFVQLTYNTDTYAYEERKWITTL